MSTELQKAEFLTRDLTSLIRIYADDALIDATLLAKRVLSPVKSELDSATHKFSMDLFIAATLHVVYNQQEPTIQRVLDCIVDPEWKTEHKMLDRVAHKISNKIEHQNVQKWRQAFFKKASALSPGIAQRTVTRCHAQWCRAFNYSSTLTNVKPLHFSKDISARFKMDELTLDCIRIGTRFELSDASALATKIISPVKNETDKTTYTFAHELFIAVALMTAHTVRGGNLNDVLKCPVDPTWDSHKQISSYIGNCSELTESKQSKTGAWITKWMERTQALPNDSLQSLTKRSQALWQKALFETSPSSDKKDDHSTDSSIPPNAIQVFNMGGIAKAVTLIQEMREERRAGGDRLLELAQENNGYRTLPDAKKAGALLEKAKSQFENLVEPINRLQLDLTLCACMDPAKFHVTPILLLGDPGIGKTYLAMELSKGMDGSMEKMSAGGAQAGFQLNGSQSSWNTAKYGQIFKALAEGKTTSPVFVIDEVDKIGSDDRYPILPVLLDLLEPGTARCFKDEFFEMDFDASRFIFIMTANSLDNVPEPLLSRVEIYDIPRPEPAQRLRIIQEQAKALREATGKNIRLDKATTQRLADLTEIDLRKTTRIVKEAFSKAIIEKSGIAKLLLPEDNGPARKGTKPAYHRSEIGFSLS